MRRRARAAVALGALLALGSGCGGSGLCPADHGAPGAGPGPGADGWIALFDGATTAHWRGYRRDAMPSNWTIEDGTLALVPRPWCSGGDIVTREPFGSFELELEWRISEGGNSGVFYRVLETDEHGAVWHSGLEMQVLDNARHRDGRSATHRAGDLYDLVASRTDATRPVGEWNALRIVVDGDRIEHWLNGTQVVAARLDTPEWDALVQGSKYRKRPGFGKAQRGHVALQDHGDRVWYRNIRIRPR